MIPDIQAFQSQKTRNFHVALRLSPTNRVAPHRYKLRLVGPSRVYGTGVVGSFCGGALRMTTLSDGLQIPYQ